MTSTFDHTRLADRLARLTGEQREQLRRKVDPADLAPAEFAALFGDTVRREPRLSPGQERLWFLHQLAPESGFYNIPSAYRMTGPLDADRLAAALAVVVDRHESLRTVVRPNDGDPRPVVGDGNAVRLRRLDGNLDEVIAAELDTPIDLQAGPPLRVTLVRLAADEHVLLVVMHHMLSDGASLGVFMDELAAAYRGDEAAPPVQFTDVAAWQRHRLRPERVAAALDRWQERLAGCPTELELPLDHPRPARHDQRGAMYRFAIDADLTERVRAFARRGGRTPFMVLLTAFAALLGRYTGQDDLVVGTSEAGRRHDDLRDVIGFFVNTLPLRIRLGEADSFAGLLDQVQGTVTDAIADAEVPFSGIVDRLGVPRTLAANPLVQVMFQVVDEETDRWQLGESVTATSMPLPARSTRFDIEVYLQPSESGLLQGWVIYAGTLFEAATIERLMTHFRCLLESALSTPEAPAAALDMLPAEEREALWRGHRELAPDPWQGRTVLDLVGERAAAQPDAVAVTCGGQRRTYRELAGVACGVAESLRAVGVAPGSFVAVLLRRQVDLPGVLLGVWQAGAAYVPVDPAYPVERVAHMVADTGAAAVVTESGLADRVPEVDCPVLCLEDVAPATGTTLGGPAPEDLAYVIYTSGSTGRPKGVEVEHGSVTRLLSRTDHWFGFGPDDVWALFHSYAFDFSVWEMCGALAYGGRLVVVPEDVARSPEALRDTLEREGVTVLCQTPSAFRGLIRADPQVPALRYIIFGGEALDVRQLRPWWDRHDDRHPQLVNMYGITETTVRDVPATVPSRPGERRDQSVG